MVLELGCVGKAILFYIAVMSDVGHGASLILLFFLYPPSSPNVLFREPAEWLQWVHWAAFQNEISWNLMWFQLYVNFRRDWYNVRRFETINGRSVKRKLTHRLKKVINTWRGKVHNSVRPLWNKCSGQPLSSANALHPHCAVRPLLASLGSSLG